MRRCCPAPITGCATCASRCAIADGLAAVLAMGDAVLLEVGPGQGLCALARQNLQGQPRTVLASTGKAQEAGADLPLMLASLGALWTRGITPDWPTVRGGGSPRRISLPTYAFDHQRHWIEPGHALPADPAGREEASPQRVRRLPQMDDWFGVPQWSPSPLPVVPAPEPGLHWLVLGGDDATTQGVLRRIADEGGRAVLVRGGSAFAAEADGSFTLDPADEAQFERLFGGLEGTGAAAGPRRAPVGPAGRWRRW